MSIAELCWICHKQKCECPPSNQPIDPELISIDTPSEGEEYNAADHLLREMESGAKKDEQDEPITAVEMLNLYDRMRRLKYDEPRILQEILSKYSITRKTTVI